MDQKRQERGSVGGRRLEEEEEREKLHRKARASWLQIYQ